MQTVFDQEKFEAAIQLLRDDRLRGFRCDIETESTIVADEQGDQKAATEMLQAVGAFMQSSLPMMQSMPAVVPLLGKMLLFMVRRFRCGVELESAMEDAIAKLEGNPGAAMVNPRAQELQAKQQESQQRLAVETQLKQQEMQQSAADHQMDLQAKQVGLQADMVKAKAEMQRAVLDDRMAQMDHERQLEAMRTQAALGPAATGQPLMPQKLEFGQGMMTRGDRR